MQTKGRIHVPTLGRAFGLGVTLWCLLFCLAALGAGEILRTYNYKGFDANGNLVVEGVIVLRVDENGKVKGDWELQIRGKGDAKELGKQSGSGKISGTLKGESILLNLNPEVFGDNVYLDGKVSRADIFRITGKWGHYGYYAGKLADGTFEMSRREIQPKKN